LAAEILLANVLGCARLQLYTRFDHQPTDDELASFRGLITRAGEHVPIAYLVGFKEFYSLSFEVTADVLVPRPETELLVERTLDLIAGIEVGAEAGVDILEVGTGSGCIAVAVCKNAPNAKFVATDVSSGALEVARRNAEEHGVSDRIVFVECDRLDLPPEHLVEGGFDVLVSNPPYIAEAEMETLPRTVRDHEPSCALHDGADGLSFYRTFAEQAAGLLKSSGRILLEIAENQGASVEALFEGGKQFKHTDSWRDTVCGHERVMCFEVIPQVSGAGEPV